MNKTENDTIWVVTGAYGHQLFGFNFSDSKLEEFFAILPHSKSIQTVKIYGRFLVSGSNDENINVYDLWTAKQYGTLYGHGGSINEIGFHENYLFSVSEDSKVFVWRTNDWEKLMELSSHKEGINSIAIHPTGRVALTVSKDKTLRMWNLLNGSLSVTKTLEKAASKVCWNNSAKKFALLFPQKLEIYSSENFRSIATFAPKSSPINCFAWINDSTLIVGLNDGSLSIYDVNNTKSPILTNDDLHHQRVSEISVIVPQQNNKPLNYYNIFSISSDGKLVAWKLSGLAPQNSNVKKNKKKQKQKIKLQYITHKETYCRLICLATGNKVKKTFRSLKTPNPRKRKTKTKPETKEKTQKNEKTNKKQNLKGKNKKEKAPKKKLRKKNNKKKQQK
ncbi:pak1 interacting protein [Anaeramoeba flamelloides]|uniref:Pak1 interacting protein n=1 Tax=Anaeramoeba flamelloides TaxID=1746091 RepID=A0ABQ8XDQ9_9EUKA|nr:pak1 interacting protein [Anaeramoeba flamelloides]